MAIDILDVDEVDAAAVKLACYGLAKDAGGVAHPTTGQVAAEADVSAVVAEATLDGLYEGDDPAVDVDVTYEDQHRIIWRVSL